MNSILIDIGGTYIKGAILDIKRKRILDLKRIALPKFVKNKNLNLRELNPNLIFLRTKKLINLLANRHKNISDIFISSQMHGCVLINNKLNAKTNFISWQDQRATEIYKKYKKSYYEILIKKLGQKRISLCGNEIKVGYPITSLCYLSENGKNLQNLTPLPLSDYILTRLLRKVPPVHHTHASGIGAYNIFTRKWDSSIIKKLNLNKISWPKITYSEEIVGQTFINKKKINCWSSGGDQQVAVLACGLKKKELSINIATGSQVALVVDKPSAGNYQLRPYFGNKYLKTITHLPAGRALNALVNLFKENQKKHNEEYIWRYVKQRVSRSKSTNLITNISFFPGTFGESGSIKNINENNLTITNLFLSSFDSMARNYYYSTKKIVNLTQLKRIVFSGGLARKIPAIQEIVAKRLNCNYRTCSSADSSLLGLGIIAFARTRSKSSFVEKVVKIKIGL